MYKYQRQTDVLNGDKCKMKLSIIKEKLGNSYSNDLTFKVLPSFTCKGQVYHYLVQIVI